MTAFFGLGQQAWPGDPTMPSAPPAGYVAPSSPANPGGGIPPMSPEQIAAYRQQFIELIIRTVLQVVQGFIPGLGAGQSALPFLQQFFGNIPVLSMFGGATSPTQANNFISNLLGIIGNPAGITSAPGTFNPAGAQIQDQNLPGVLGILGGLFGGIMGLPGGGASQTQAADAVAAQADVVVGHSAMLAQVLAGQAPAPSDPDDFERVSSTNLGPTLWDQYFSGSGTWATPNGHDASWTGNFTTDFVCRRKTTQSVTDAQISTIVLGTAPHTSIIPLPANGHNDAWVRMSNFSTYATRTGVRVRFSGNGGWRLSAFSNGAEVAVLATGTVTAPAAGATISLEAVTNTRHFIVKLNNTTIPGGDVTEVGTASQLGTAFRYYGHGGRAEYVTFFIPPFFQLSRPGSLRQWTAVG